MLRRMMYGILLPAYSTRFVTVLLWSLNSNHSQGYYSNTGLQTLKMVHSWMCVQKDSGGTSNRVHPVTASPALNQCAGDMREKKRRKVEHRSSF